MLTNQRPAGRCVTVVNTRGVRMKTAKFLATAVMFTAVSVAGSAAQAHDAALWQGAYVGVHAGGDFGKFSAKSGSGSETINGIEGGFHAGYNWQAGSMVYGLEGDADLSGAKKDFKDPGFTATLSNGFLGSLRGRVGFTSGQALFYGTGGVAFGSTKVSAAATGFGSGSIKDTTTGYVLGLGMEYALSSNLSARIEGLHYGFKDVFKDDVGSGLKYDANVVRAGLSYKF
jgi:outer membrane immunogenic protein